MINPVIQGKSMCFMLEYNLLIYKMRVVSPVPTPVNLNDFYPGNLIHFPFTVPHRSEALDSTDLKERSKEV